ncbi:MAG: NmrA family NAD(P)-binding protein [Actinobacteria bacterium]|nr:NmrA family NAD(P)-binding protein [Actinomycetota bacterium]
MPVIVVGAGCPLGKAVVEALQPHLREVRAFVADAAAPAGAALRAAGARVAIGDPADASHVAAAADGAFTAVLLADEAPSPGALRGWAEAVAEAGVTRSLWVGGAPDEGPPTPESAEVAAAGRPLGEVAAEVVALDDRAAL